MEFRCFVKECSQDPHFDWTFNDQHTFSCKEHQIHDLSTFISRQEVPGARKILLKAQKKQPKPFPKIWLFTLAFFFTFAWFLFYQHLNINSVLQQVLDLRLQTEGSLKCEEELKTLEELMIKLTGKVKKPKPSVTKGLKDPSSGSNIIISTPPADSSKLDALEEISRTEVSLKSKTQHLVRDFGLIFDEKTSEVLSISFLADSQVLLFGTMAGSIHSVDLSRGVTERLYSGKHRIYKLIDLQADDAVLVTGNSNMQEINFKFKVIQKNIPAHANWILATRLSHDRSFLVTGSCDKLVKIWNFPNYSLKSTFQGHSADIWSSDISWNNSLVVTSDEMGQMILWDLSSQRLLKRFKSSKFAIYSVLFNSQASLIYSGSGDGFIRIWDIQSESIVKTLSHPGMVREISLTPDYKLLLSVSGTSLRVWDLETFEVIQEIIHPADLKSLKVSQDGKVAVTGDNSNRVWLWEIDTGRLVGVFGGSQKNIKAIVLPDDLHVAVEEPGLVRIWEVESSKLVQVIHEKDQLANWEKAFGEIEQF